MRIPQAIAAGILVLILGAAARAEEPAPPAKPLTLRNCIDIALKNQVDVQAARNSVTSARSRVTSAMSAYFPQLDIQMGSTVNGSNYRDYGTNTIGDNAATLTMNFLDGGAREAKVRQARASMDSAGSGLQRAIQSCTFTVTRNYFDLLRARHLLEVADQQVKFAEGQRDLVRGRIDTGDAAESDIYPVEAQLANAKVSQLSARNQVRIAETELQRSMGISPAPGFAIQDITDKPTGDLPTEEACLKEALAKRPDLAQAEAQVRASRASVSLARTEVYPRLIANGRVGQDLSLSNLGSANRDWSLYGGLALNLFDAGAARAGVRDAQASLDTSEARREQMKKDIAAEVKEAILNLASARERLAASEVSLTAAQKNAEVQNEKYTHELAIPLDLINAQVALATAQSNAVEALYDYYISQAQLDLAIGK